MPRKTTTSKKAAAAEASSADVDDMSPSPDRESISGPNADVLVAIRNGLHAEGDVFSENADDWADAIYTTGRTRSFNLLDGITPELCVRMVDAHAKKHDGIAPLEEFCDGQYRTWHRRRRGMARSRHHHPLRSACRHALWRQEMVVASAIVIKPRAGANMVTSASSNMWLVLRT